MAIYHLTTKVVKRSSGRSAVAAAAYRSGDRLRDETTERDHDYSRREGREEITSWIQAPENAPEWAEDRERLWNQVEHSERRRDAQVAREVETALPKELDREQQEQLVESYVREQFTERGMVADVNLHRADENNPHAHIMLTTREISEEGFGNKNRDWNKGEELGRWREGWERASNRELERAGFQERVSHQSHEERGITRQPTIHEGPARKMEERGERNAAAEHNREVERNNTGREQREQEVSREMTL